MNLSRFFTLDELTYSQTAAAERIDNRPALARSSHCGVMHRRARPAARVGRAADSRLTPGIAALHSTCESGGTKSQHLTGQAPISVSRRGGPRAVQDGDWSRLPFDQIIYEVKGASKWVHVSHNPGATVARSAGKFGADGKVTYPRITAQQALEMTEPVTRGMASQASQVCRNR